MKFNQWVIIFNDRENDGLETVIRENDYEAQGRAGKVISRTLTAKVDNYRDADKELMKARKAEGKGKR